MTALQIIAMAIAIFTIGMDAGFLLERKFDTGWNWRWIAIDAIATAEKANENAAMWMGMYYNLKGRG